MRYSLLLCLLLAACDPPDTMYTDQDLRHQYFTDCLDRAAKVTPKTIADRGSWSEVVSQCENAAYYQSVRKNSRTPTHV